MPLVSVLMPTYDQANFLGRAIDSLLGQRLADWELIVVDDGSPDGTADVVKPYLDDPRVRYERLPRNRGLGAALNHGLGLAAGRFVAYLPSDDVYYADHLSTLAAGLEDGAVLAYSGVRHHYNRSSAGVVPG